MSIALFIFWGAVEPREQSGSRLPPQVSARWLARLS